MNKIEQYEVKDGDWVAVDRGSRGLQIGVARYFTQCKRLVWRSSQGNMYSEFPELHLWVDFASGNGNECVPFSKVLEVRKAVKERKVVSGGHTFT